MNTIKIYLDSSGAVADLQKDFPLYQFQYNNKLLNIYVPTSICVGPFIDENTTTGFVCVVSMKNQNFNGIQKQTGAYACRFVKTLTQNGIEYNLFERALPYSFTIFAGQGQAAPTIYVSILNVSDGALLSMINSQSVHIDVMESNDEFDADFEVDPSAAVELQSQIDAISALMPYKQNADTTYDGENKIINPDGDNHTVVKNINDLILATSGIPALQSQVDQNTADIADLRTLSVYGWNVVGTHEIVSQSAQDDNAIPSDADLISWIEALKGSTIAVGDAIFIYWDNAAHPDSLSLFWYASTEYNNSYFRQVPAVIHMAGNSIAGLMEGNYSVDLTGKADQLMINILNGKIVNIYKVKHDESGLIELKSIMDVVENITNAVVAVPKAIGDEDGSNIKLTYWKVQDGKKYVQDYASPKALYDLNYPDYATGEYKDLNVNDTSYRKQVTVSTTGYTQLAVLTKDLEADILLGNQNGCTNKIWIASTHTEALYIKITTQYIDGDGVTQTLAITNDLPLALTTGNYALITIESIFSSLTTPVTLPAGTTIIQTIEIKREDSTSATFTLDCNDYQHEAYMTLNKVGFVRYSLELEPSAIETANDNVTINAAGDLEVTGDGTIHYNNGDSALLTTILKLPIITSKSGIVLAAIKPVTAGAIKAALDDKADKWTIDTAATSPITLGKRVSSRPSSVVGALTINLPATIDLDFESEIEYATDSTTSLTDNTGATYTGDDVTAGQFDPQPSKRYSVFYYNASANSTPNIQAIVRGV